MKEVEGLHWRWEIDIIVSQGLKLDIFLILSFLKQSKNIKTWKNEIPQWTIIIF